jgi:hypothetical protein
MTVARLLVVVVAIAGCSRTFAKEAVQPNPVAHPTETLRGSEQITIVTGQMGLLAPDAPQGVHARSGYHQHRYPLFNAAKFSLVSRDRMRFHVQIDHTWEEWADLNTWDVTLTDDRGRTWHPESVEHVHKRVLTTMWDADKVSQICDAHGRDVNGDCVTIAALGNDTWVDRQPLGSISVYRGTGDFVFYERDMMSPDVHWMKLVVKRSGQSFEFTWRFEDAVAQN